MTTSFRHSSAIWVASCLIIACTKSASNVSPTTLIDSTTVKPAPQGDVYIAGAAANAQGYTNAVYWKNGKMVELANSTLFNRATAIYVSGSDVYVAGNIGGRAAQAVYWKNGVIQIVDAVKTDTSAATGITLINNNVYVSFNVFSNGNYYGYSYGINGSGTFDPGFPSMSNTVVSSGENVYYGGSSVFVLGASNHQNIFFPSPGYYRNGTALYGLGYDLTGIKDPEGNDGTGSGVVSGMCTSGADIYSAGSQSSVEAGDYGTAESYPIYWKNQVPIALPATPIGAATSIAVSGSDVYVGGWNYSGQTSKGAYWKNKTLSVLNTQNSFSIVNAIGVSGSDVYCVGNDNENAGSEVDHAVYWKNSAEVALSSASFSEANGIFITQ